MALLLMGGAGAADFLATSLAISYYGAIGESNPVALIIYGNWGLWGFAIAKVLGAIVIAVSIKKSRMGSVAAGFAAGLWTFGALTALWAILTF